MEPAPSSPRLIGAPWRIYVGFAGLFLFGMVLVVAFRRPPTPSTTALYGLALQATLCLALAITSDRAPNRLISGVRFILLATLGSLTALTGYFFGPNSAMAAFIGLALSFAGLRAGETDRAAVVEGWITYVVVAGGQATVLALVVLRILPDVSLTSVIVRDNPSWHHAANHVAIQVIYLGAFMAGAYLQRRYRSLVLEHDELVRSTSLKEALIAEAKADYQHALAVAGDGLFSGQRIGAVQLGRVVRREGRREVYEVVDGNVATSVLAMSGTSVIVEDTPEPSGASCEPPAVETTVPDPSAPVAIVPSGPQWPTPTPTPVSLVSTTSHVVRKAYFHKMVRLHLSVVLLCGGGGSLVVVIAYDPRVALFSSACIAGVLGAIALQWWLNRGRVGDIVHWPGIFMGAFSIGPGAAFGIHSGYTVVVGSIMFMLGAFQADQRRKWMGGILFVPFAAMATHAITFALIYSRTIPDLGYVPMLRPDTTWWEPVLLHVLVQAIFIGAFFAGVMVDHRHGELRLRVAEAALEAALKGNLLAAARAELESVLSRQNEGIFTNQEVGAYRVGRLLGRGGMGEVYEATRGEQRVALKVIRRERIGDPRTLQMFLDERDAVSRVRSDHVARVIDAGMPVASIPYIAMEYIEGRSLSAMLHARGRLSLDKTRVLTRHILTGLADVHRAGVLHRDVKPQNIMMTTGHGQPRWVLIDFGVARLITGVPELYIVGTYAYMAPEQAAGNDVDLRADLYSLCVVVYRALTGRLAASDTPGRDRKTRGALPDPEDFVSIPRDVALVLRIGLARDRQDRFASAGQLLEAFEAAWQQRLPAPLRERARLLLEREPWAETTIGLDKGESTRRRLAREQSSSLAS